MLFEQHVHDIVCLTFYGCSANVSMVYILNKAGVILTLVVKTNSKIFCSIGSSNSNLVVATRHVFQSMVS